MENVNPKRIRPLNSKPQGDGLVIYWMQRDQRVQDNWALLHAQELALSRKVPLVVCFNVVPKFLDATIRQYGFMLKGLAEVEKSLAEKHVPFFLLQGDPIDTVPALAKKLKAGVVVTDFSPMKIVRKWKSAVAKSLTSSVLEVDAHNVVPVWEASPKLEFGAYTIRPKIHRLLPEFLTHFPKLKTHPHRLAMKQPSVDWKKVIAKLEVDLSVPEVSWCKPGEKAAHNAFNNFITKRYKKYSSDRNDPTKEAQSEMSPYIHFGQISAQRMAWEVSQMPTSESKESFLEELVVRRELADNFCLYNDHYDSFDGFPEWAKKTLNQHKHDKREYIYSYKQLEQGKTHDPLWNAAQMEMVHHGKMHNYMRMYWAKKILEWTPDPETALKYAIKLNDTFELDGRDPNGYVGCAWSIGGVHDRAWGEREIFGKIRYMSYNGAKGKFDIQGYIQKVEALSGKTLF